MANLPLDPRRMLTIFQRSLRRALLGSRLVVPAAAVAFGTGCAPCPPVDEIFLLREPDAETQALIDACRDPIRHDCTPLCVALSGQSALEHCELHEDRDGYLQVHVGWEDHCPGGRRPRRLAFGRAGRAGSIAGEWFAGLCQLEAASVPAFETLGTELAWAEAPGPLLTGAASAADDERRHTRMAARLARRFGAEPAQPRVAPTGARSLADLAEENAVEGCVREAYGAALAFVQAVTSSDPVVRAAMNRIAADESRHAALAMAVDRWATGRLGARARARVRDARAAAVAELRAGAGKDWSPELGVTVGLPPRSVAVALVDQLAGDLWA
jgi:hypothetical protein